MPRPAFTVGLEEEYLLIDLNTYDLVRDSADVLQECREILGDQVSPEFLQAQIEVGTRVCTTMAEAREDLRHLRSVVCEVADHHGLGLIAASTHPFAAWDEQQVTPRERYNLLARDLQAVVRRLVICGMHVHVGVENPDLRIDLLNQASYFLPHLLGLSTSSPFWRGLDTGLKSYRMSVFYSMPRTGLPEQFSSWGEYQRHVAVLVEAGLIDDASNLWWDIRPGARFPTIEMRIADVCTRLEDGLTVAALFLSLLGMLFERRRANQRWRTYADMLVSENIWRAQRYGVEGSLADFGRGVLVPYPDLVEEMIELVRSEAEAFGCVGEIEGARRILAEGTSADRQLAAYRSALESGADEREALREVVAMLVVDTRAGI